MEPLKLADLIGTNITILFTDADPKIYTNAKLLGVEAGGIWLSSQTFTNAILQALGVPVAANTPAFFFPCHSISLIMSAVEGETALDETGFGV